MTVYVITWSVFHATKGAGLDKIGPDDAFKFRVCAFLILLI